MSLRQKIEKEIAERGAMRFSRYMEMCLYDPDWGYYSRNVEQFGKAGDFYTSSDVHAVFGRLMARQFEEMWRVLDRPAKVEILELGPGRGLFAQDVLDWSAKKFPEFFAALHYSLLEQSPTLRARIEKTLTKHLENGRAGFAELETLPSDVSTDAVIVFANEFFDALPVEIISGEGAICLTAGLAETQVTPSDPELELLDRYSVRPNGGERVEVPLTGQRYAAEIAAKVERGFFVAIDYGYTRAEQMAGRYRGTLMSYRQHAASANPYQAPGEQDITAHVNFTALTAALEAQGFAAQPLVTQSQFLLGIGEPNQFADAFEECGLPQERAKVALQLKHLITPSGVGESFQVLAAGKGVDAANLLGLSFGKARSGLDERF